MASLTSSHFTISFSSVSDTYIISLLQIKLQTLLLGYNDVAIDIDEKAKIILYYIQNCSMLFIYRESLYIYLCSQKSGLIPPDSNIDHVLDTTIRSKRMHFLLQ
jgi:hypothetical protein